MPKQTLRYQRVGLIYNPEKAQAQAEWTRLKRWLEKRRVEVIGGTRVTPAMKKAQLIIAVGGDGTVLRAARGVAPWNIPVVGVNVGRLGFLAATDGKTAYKIMSEALQGRWRVESRMMLSASGIARGRRFGPLLALNDCVVRSGSTGRILQMQASVQGKPLATYGGDGLIVATPTGSTAYNLAASGPIVHPDIDVLLLSPICPHSLSQRPLVLQPFEAISVQMLKPSPPACLSLDGVIVATLAPGDKVEIRRAAEQVHLLMNPERTFYEVLQSKLKWGGA